MKTAAVAAVGLMVSVACGGAPASEAEFGVTAQPISMPAGYGRERGSGEVCDSDWSGGICYVPDDKAMVMNFRAGSW